MRATLMLDRGRDREGGISEGADRDSHLVCPPFQDVMNGGAATGTEGEGDLSAGIPGPDEVHSLPLDTDARALETRLYAERTPSSALACLAVANRHPGRCAGNMGTQLPTATGCGSECHGARQRSELGERNRHSAAAHAPQGLAVSSGGAQALQEVSTIEADDDLETCDRHPTGFSNRDRAGQAFSQPPCRARP